jgi:hypothetical protein
MYCPKCGKDNPEGSSFCNSCGESFAVPAQSAAPLQAQGPVPARDEVPHVPNHMAWAIISIFLCWPFAIAAIVNAVRVDDRLALGDVPGARVASERAKTWATVATVIGVIGYAFAVIARVTNFLF